MSNLKRKWYETLIERIDNAIENEYYFEVLFISYMIIDDRIKSLCKVRGIDVDYQDSDGNTRTKMLGKLTKALEGSIEQSDLAKKLFAIPIPIATTAEMQLIHDEVYLRENFKDLIQAPRKLYCHSFNAGMPNSIYTWDNNDPRGIIDYINRWKDRRNHWMHQAGDENLTKDELNNELIPLALDGAILARELCDFVSSYKRRLTIE